MTREAPLVSEFDRDDARVDQTLALLYTLVASLPAVEVEQFVRDLMVKYKIGSTTRSGKLLGTILKILPKKEQWSVAEIKQEIGEQGIEAEQKQVFNAMQYLKRTGRIRRIGYGQYLVDGAVLNTLDDLGLPSARHEDAYRVDMSNE